MASVMRLIPGQRPGYLANTALRRGLYLLALCFLLIQQQGCSINTQLDDTGDSPVFYPPLPNQPRIQLLTTINAAKVKSSDRTGFTDFILGEAESQGSHLTKPYGVSYYDKQVFVVDTRGSGYIILSANDEIKKTVVGSGASRMQKPINISLDSEGNRYITDTELNQVLVFDNKDKFVRAYGKKDQFKPADVVVKGNSVFVSDLKHHVVHVLDKKTGFTRRVIGKRGSGKGELFFPTNIAFTPEGHILVSDTGNYRLQLFTERGQFLRQYGEAGSGLGQFARPKGIAVDKEGRIYAVDSSFENIQLFNSDGQLLLYFGKPGNNPDNINLPADITIQYSGVEQFKKFASKRFDIEYLIFVSSQFGPNKVTVYGFGKYRKPRPGAEAEAEASSG